MPSWDEFAPHVLETVLSVLENSALSQPIFTGILSPVCPDCASSVQPSCVSNIFSRGGPLCLAYWRRLSLRRTTDSWLRQNRLHSHACGGHRCDFYEPIIGQRGGRK